MNKIKSFVYIFAPLIFGGFIGFLVRKDYGYIDTIPHNIKVPSFVFIIAWTIIYLLIGYWSYLTDRREENKDLVVYWIGLGLNLAYMPLFFTFHQKIPSLALVVILFFVNLILFYRDKTKSKYLLLPYIIWLLFAIVLMLDIVISK